MPQCLNTGFNPAIMNFSSPVMEESILQYRNNHEKHAIIHREKILIKYGKIRREIRNGTPWLVPVVSS